MSDDLFRLPPDGTGKRMSAGTETRLHYDAATASFNRDDTVTGAGSGTSGTVTRVVASTGTDGFIFVQIDSIQDTFNDGEALQVAGSTIATADGTGEYIYTQVMTIGGGNNHENHAHVDNRGAIFTRFTEGSPQFDAFGKLQTSKQNQIGNYIHTFDEQPEIWTVYASGGGTVTHEASTAGVLHSCGTASGDLAKRVSNLYHPYIPGQSQLIEISLAVGDSGKANVIRQWGYGDDNDGLFFQLDGTTLSVAMRSTTGVGNMSAAQSAWNVDRVDGTKGDNNPSGKNLDVSTIQLYWIDFQWLGAGRARFGVVIDGVRIVCHEMYHANVYPTTFMRSGALPLYIRQENTGLAASSSELRLFCAAVATEGSFKPREQHYGQPLASAVYVSSITNVPLLSGRAKEKINGVENRSIILPRNFLVFTTGDPCIVELVRNPTLTGATFTGTPASSAAAEVDFTASVISSGRVLSTYMADAGSHTIDVRDVFHINGEFLNRNANVSATANVYTLQARNLVAGASTTVFVGANWEEIIQ